MEYAKPEVAVLGSAVNTIQSSQWKLRLFCFDGFISFATTAAYEADE